MSRLAKKFYSVVALLAVIHLLLFTGAAVFLMATGRLNVESAKGIVEALHPVTAPEPNAETAENSGEGIAESDIQSPATSDDAQELQRRHSERARMQAQHQMMLARRLRVELDREREEFEQRVARQAAVQADARQTVSAAGFEKEVEELALMKPKVAVQRLLSRPIDDAARLLTAMDARTSKKIIESAYKDPAKWTQMLEVLDRKRQLAALASAPAETNG